METRYIANDFSPLLKVDDPERHFRDALEAIITKLSPRQDYTSVKVSRLWTSPTGLA